MQFIVPKRRTRFLPTRAVASRIRAEEYTLTKKTLDTVFHVETLKFWGEMFAAGHPGLQRQIERGNFSDEAWMPLKKSLSSMDLRQVIATVSPRWASLPQANEAVLGALSEKFLEIASESPRLDAACEVFSKIYAIDYHVDRWMAYTLLFAAFPEVVEKDVSKHEEAEMSKALERVMEASSYGAKKKAVIGPMPRSPLATEYVRLMSDMTREDLFLTCGDVVFFVEENKLNPGKEDNAMEFMIDLLASSIRLFPLSIRRVA